MKKISFLEDAFESIFSGKKTQTIRLGEHFNVGDLVELVNQAGVHKGYLEILSMSRTTLAELELDDALKNGWRSLEALKSRIKCIYPESNEGTLFTKIQYRFRPT